MTATHPSGLVLTAVIVGLWWLSEALWKPAGRPDADRGPWRARVGDLGALASTLAVALVLSAPVIYGTIKIADNNELSGFSSLDDTGESESCSRRTSVQLHDSTQPHRSGLGSGTGVDRCGGADLAALLGRLGDVAVVFVLLAANLVVLLGPLSGPLGALGGYFANSSHRLTFVTAMFAPLRRDGDRGCRGLGVAVARGRTSVRTGTKTLRAHCDSDRAGGRVGAHRRGAVYRYPANAHSASKQRTGRLVGPDDIVAYRCVADQPDARKALILNNLDQGTGWIYPVTGLTPMFPFYRANDFSQRQRDLYWAVSKIGVDPHVDAIVRDMNVHYVIDSPPSYWPFQNGGFVPERGSRYPVPRCANRVQPSLTPVFRRGNVT